MSQWSVVDVQKWFRKSCGEYYADYAEKLLEQDITGRTQAISLTTVTVSGKVP